MKSLDKNKVARPPVVVVMGHIDHGKSTLLDYIRKTNTAAKEAGGITQHIAAYETECEVGGQKRLITFLDTPGHEAFCAIRERGASIADLSVLVVSAEDGVKPQTIEVLKSLKTTRLPFIVAINKIDKPGANVDKVKQSLAEHDVLVEGWGGSIPTVPISAKTGENIGELLEMIVLQADLEELTGDESAEASGFIIESHLNPKQGIRATLVIKDGSLKIGDFIATQNSYTRVKMIEDHSGKTINQARFSSPICITGWTALPKVGSEFRSFKTKEEAIAFSETVEKNIDTKITQLPKEGAVVVDLVVKADTLGTLEAIEYELQKQNTDKVQIRIIGSGVGAVNESDVKLANIKKNTIVVFNVPIEKSSEALANREKIEIKSFNIIYELTDFVKNLVKAATPVAKIEVVTGAAKVLRIFNKSKGKQVIGGKVEKGELKQGNMVKILRREALIGEGKIRELQSQKIKAEMVKTGQEFGMSLETKLELVEGDVLQAISWVEE